MEEKDDDPDLKRKTECLGKVYRKFSSEMSEILPNLFIGNRRNASCQEQLQEKGIKRIFAIHDRPLSESSFNQIHPYVNNYKFVKMSDSVDADISSIFKDAVQFLHDGRMMNEPVLVHCLIGQSRSVTIVAAYITTIFGLDGPTALQFIRQRRKQADPNIGFIVQLNHFATNTAHNIRNEFQIPKQCYEEDRSIINKYCPFALST